jgi:hypothetical protein
MGILEGAIPAIVICTRDRERAKSFYRGSLGLGREKGVAFNIYQHLNQDDAGIWTAPGGA